MTNPIKIYHIVHMDRLASIINDGYLLSDAIISQRTNNGSMIGLNNIKNRRLTKTLSSYPDLYVGQCVPFYFCPRSVMLYLIHRQNPELMYQGGQEPIIHFQADFYQVVTWANAQNPPIRWAFTSSNAGSYYFEDFNSLDDLQEINWDAIKARYWSEPAVKEGKQAEFLVEKQFPWHLIEHIGVYSNCAYNHVVNTLQKVAHKPKVEIIPGWYY
ncbi:type II toxin-antitoxin system toxin DNA ADP-ribosyl transferase DarT [Lonepinella sp. BR2930]|uniref:type II toxin-antitoxin system toxin DNA ADP-ribosyl transferase DarT n=1 Tax=Lonepinella sp. BR2930 TaxID=3434554 RepID=UPI003F6DE540